MILEIWPESILPLPSISYNIDAEYSNIKSAMDSGRLRQRPRFSRELEIASATFELNRLQYSAFRYFWDVSINRGNDWFQMRLPLPDTNSLTDTEIRFVSDYKAQYRPVGNWDISVSIEIKESETIDAEYFELLTIEGSDLTNWLYVISNLYDEIEHWEDEHSFNLAP